MPQGWNAAIGSPVSHHSRNGSAEWHSAHESGTLVDYHAGMGVDGAFEQQVVYGEGAPLTTVAPASFAKLAKLPHTSGLEYPPMRSPQSKNSTTASEDSGDAVEAIPGQLSCMTYGAGCSPTSKVRLSNSGNGDGTGWWRLIWCHERCHKQECEPLRRAISEAARDAHASLLCLKKASKFAVWLAQVWDQRQPFALLTDWREVKPCIQAASAHPPQNRPAFTVVLCEVQRHFERASAWAQTLPPRSDPVHVCKDSRLLHLFLGDLRDKVIEMGSVPMSPGSPKQAEIENASPKSYPPGSFQCQPWGAATDTALCGKSANKVRGRNAPLEISPTHGGDFIPWEMAAAFGEVNAIHKVPSFGEVNAIHKVPSFGEVNAIHKVPSAVQMEQLLREAMPDHYDD